jgi:hypothetical protein
MAARGLDLAKQWGDRAQEAHALRILGEISIHRNTGSQDQTVGLYEQAMSLAASLGMRPLIARIHLGLGLLHVHTGDRDKALGDLTTAAAGFRDMEMASWLIRTEAEVSRLR